MNHITVQYFSWEVCQVASVTFSGDMTSPIDVSVKYLVPYIRTSSCIIC